MAADPGAGLRRFETLAAYDDSDVAWIARENAEKARIAKLLKGKLRAPDSEVGRYCRALRRVLAGLRLAARLTVINAFRAVTSRTGGALILRVPAGHGEQRAGPGARAMAVRAQ